MKKYNRNTDEKWFYMRKEKRQKQRKSEEEYYLSQPDRRIHIHPIKHENTNEGDSMDNDRNETEQGNKSFTVSHYRLLRIVVCNHNDNNEYSILYCRQQFPAAIRHNYLLNNSCRTVDIETMKKPLLFSIIFVFGLCSHLAAFQTGYASWYGGKFQGRPTANGEAFDTDKLTAAHRTLPFNTIVRVTNLKNNRSVVVRVNDRGPFVQGRIIDLSRAAAQSLDMIKDGTAPVQIEILSDRPQAAAHPDRSAPIAGDVAAETVEEDRHAAKASGENIARSNKPETPETEYSVLPLPAVHEEEGAFDKEVAAADTGVTSVEEKTVQETALRETRAESHPEAALQGSRAEPLPATSLQEARTDAKNRPLTFIVQVGSFSVLENALNLKRKLEAEGFAVAFEPAGNGIMRVVLPDILHTELSGTQERLASAGISDILIRRK